MIILFYSILFYSILLAIISLHKIHCGCLAQWFIKVINENRQFPICNAMLQWLNGELGYINDVYSSLHIDNFILFVFFYAMHPVVRAIRFPIAGWVRFCFPRASCHSHETITAIYNNPINSQRTKLCPALLVFSFERPFLSDILLRTKESFVLFFHVITLFEA